MKKQITKTKEADWNPLVEEGIKTNGIYVKILRHDEETKRPPTFMLKFDAGASYPNHNHPAGEEVFILEGEVRFGPDQLNAGDYLYTPPNATPSVFSRTRCTMLSIVPEEVEVLK
jgi:quercetin dioxygenase-like cupin family protein